LLEISKLESGKIELHTVDIELAMFLDQICSHFEVLATERQIDFRRLFNRNIVAHLDVEKIERIVFNLLSNAFKFTPEKGVIAMSSKLGNDGKDFTIIVEDSGPGIPEQMWPKIFQRFLTLGDNEGGAGLGLAIVKELTEAHGGHASINKSVHGGVRMEITLPVTLHGHSPAVKRTMNPSSGTSLGAPVANTAAQMMAELRSHLQRDNAQQLSGAKPVQTSPITVPNLPIRQISPTQANSTRQGNGPSENSPLILVVEDNVAMNSFLRETLSREYRVVTAVNGQEGVKLALKYVPDCIVSDVMMPVMSGEEMVQIIRDHRELETVPILLLTAKADDELKVRLLRSGVQDFLQKPFKLDDLLARVRNLVTMRQTWDSLQRALQAQNKNLRELVDDITTLFGQEKFHTLPHTITQQFGDLVLGEQEGQQEPDNSNSNVSLDATTDFDESTSEDEDEESSDAESNESAEETQV
jgi:DNA-binding response OmpR family regulator/two-component sensor histidine kinase